MTVSKQTIPDVLIYEMDNGKPIYYRGYKDVLKGEKEVEQIMGSSYLQALLVTHLVVLLSRMLDFKEYRLMSNELGLLFAKRSWRSADIAIYSTASLKGIPLHNKYMNTPPEIVIEVDTKADFSDDNFPSSYYQKKTDQLLDFGVQKVIWIYTETQKVMVAEPNQPWQTHNWNTEIQVIENASINIAQIIKALELE